MTLIKQAKKHLYREIKGVDEGFAAADTDKDGYIKFKEYVRLVQYESEKAIIRVRNNKVVTWKMNFLIGEMSCNRAGRSRTHTHTRAANI